MTRNRKMGTREEYRAKYLSVIAEDQHTLVHHWELGRLFVKSHDSYREIAEVLGSSFSFVQRHALVGRVIPLREKLDLLVETTNISCWHHLLQWAQRQSGVPTSDSTEIRSRVPEHIRTGIAQQGYDPKEVVNLFWLRVDVETILDVARPNMSLLEEAMR
jgi:hypothetical protein